MADLGLAQLERSLAILVDWCERGPEHRWWRPSVLKLEHSETVMVDGVEKPKKHQILLRCAVGDRIRCERATGHSFIEALSQAADIADKNPDLEPELELN
jgi:hypothetical protein